MILSFTEEEYEYMENLRPTEDCPDDIRASIERKLALLRQDNSDADRHIRDAKRFLDMENRSKT